jgi:hypothetical protein
LTDTEARRIEDKLDVLTVAFAKLEGSLSPTLEKISQRQDDADKRDKDYEERLRKLERFRYGIPSLALLSFLISVGSVLYYLSHS